MAFRRIDHPDGSITLVVDDESALILPAYSDPTQPPTSPPFPLRPLPRRPNPKRGPRVTIYQIDPEMDQYGLQILPHIITPESLRDAVHVKFFRPGATINLLARDPLYRVSTLVNSARDAGVYVQLLSPGLPELLE